MSIADEAGHGATGLQISLLAGIFTASFIGTQGGRFRPQTAVRTEVTPDAPSQTLL
jgi:hypothetical protein